MIFDCFVVLMTINFIEQIKFYKDVLNLELIFYQPNAVGLGKNNRIYILLKEDKSENSHHLSEHKGPQIITFKCQGDINQYLEKIKALGIKVRDRLKLPEHNTQYLFIEDYDCNEICLDFPLSFDPSTGPPD